jgi:dCTP deaminase
MAFWNSKRLASAIPAQEIVRGFRPERVKNCAYELSVGPQHYSTDMKGGVGQTPDSGTIEIPPGQLAILVTAETVRIPISVIGFISMKFSAKVRGLINVSGFHVDPGFEGHLKFAVYNAGSRPALFSPGQALFQLWLADLDAAAEPYDGIHEGGNRISQRDVMDLQGDVASPAQLRAAMDALEEKTAKDIAGITNATGSALGSLRNELRILEGVFLALIGVFVANLVQGNPSPINVYTSDRSALESKDQKGNSLRSENVESVIESRTDNGSALDDATLPPQGQKDTDATSSPETPPPESKPGDDTKQSFNEAPKSPYSEPMIAKDRSTSDKSDDSTTRSGSVP